MQINLATEYYDQRRIVLDLTEVKIFTLECLVSIRKKFFLHVTATSVSFV